MEYKERCPSYVIRLIQQMFRANNLYYLACGDIPNCYCSLIIATGYMVSSVLVPAQAA